MNHDGIMREGGMGGMGGMDGAARDAQWAVTTHGFVGLRIRWTVKILVFVDLDARCIGKTGLFVGKVRRSNFVRGKAQLSNSVRGEAQGSVRGEAKGKQFCSLEGLGRAVLFVGKAL